MSVKEIKEKANENRKRIMLERYGVDSPLKIPCRQLEYKEKRRKKLKERVGKANPAFGKIWINNGIINRCVPKYTVLENQWAFGMVFKKRGKYINRSPLGDKNFMLNKIWVNNGLTNKPVPRYNVLEKGWYYGILSFKNKVN